MTAQMRAMLDELMGTARNGKEIPIMLMVAYLIIKYYVIKFNFNFLLKFNGQI